jgi:hypothetical protein
MTESWEILFNDYWKNRPGAPFGHNPKRVFEAGFVAGMLKGSLTANKELIDPTVCSGDTRGRHYFVYYVGVDGRKCADCGLLEEQEVVK